MASRYSYNIWKNACSVSGSVRNTLIAGFASLCLLFICGVIVILRGPLELGGDESMEFAKVLSVQRHPESVENEWNEQPWFYSVMLAHSGDQFIYVGRIISLILYSTWCSLLLFAFVRRISIFVALCLPWLVMVMDTAFMLPFSVMLELPAILLPGIGLLLVLIFRDSFVAMFAAGVLSGVGISIKYSGLLLMPSIVLAILLTGKSFRPIFTGCNMGRVFVYGFCVVGVFVFILLNTPRNSFSNTLLLHFNLSTSNTGDALKYAFGVQEVFAAPGLLALVLIGCAVVIRARDFQSLFLFIFPIIAIVLIHSVHRPYWKFYEMHYVPFIIPCAIIGLQYLCECVTVVCTSSQLKRTTVNAILLVASVCSLMLVVDARNVISAFKWLYTTQRAVDNKVVSALKSFNDNRYMGVAYDPIYLSWAGISCVPSTVILSQKRFWLNDISDSRLREIILASKPEFLILPFDVAEKDNNDWSTLLSTSYVLVDTSSGFRVFIAKRLNPLPELIPLEDTTRLFFQ